MADFTISGKVTLDISDLIRGMVETKRLISSADSDVNKLSRDLDELAAKNPTVDVNVRGIAHDHEEIAKLKAELDTLRNKDVNIRVDKKGQMKKDLEGITSAVGSAAGGLTSLLIPGLITLAATISGPVVGALGGLAVAGAASLGTMTVGIGAFAALAIPTFMEVKNAITQYDKIQKQILAANTPKKMATALQEQAKWAKTLDPGIAGVVKQFFRLKDAWDKAGKALQPQVVAGISTAFSILTKLLKPLVPIAQDVAGAFNVLLTDISKTIDTRQFKKFFDYVLGNAGDFIITWGRAFGNFLGGIANITMAFDPLTKMFNDGLLGMSKSFLNWSSTLEQNKGFQKFVAFVKTEGPKVWKTLKDIGKVIVDIVVALAPLGGKVIDGLDKLAQWADHMITANPKLVTTALAIGGIAAAAVKLAPLAGALGPIAEAIGGIATAGGIGGATGGLALVAAGVLAIAVAFSVLGDKAGFVKQVWTPLVGLWKTVQKDMTDAWHTLQQVWGWFDKNNQISKNFTDGLGHVVHGLSELEPILKPLAIVLGTVVIGAIWALAEAFKFVATVWDDVVTTFMEGAKASVKIFEWFYDHVILPVARFVKTVWGWFTWLYDHLVGHSLIPDLVKAIVKWFASLPGKVLSAIAGLAKSMLAWGSNLLTSALRGIQAAWTAVASWFGGVGSRILSAIGDLGHTLWQAGSNIIGGFLDGLKSKWHDVTSFVGGIGSWIASHKGPLPKDLLLLQPAGQAIIKGLGVGMQKQMPALKAILADIGATVAGPSIGMGALAAAGGGNTNVGGVNITQHIDASGNAHPEDVKAAAYEGARQALDEVARRMNRGFRG